MANRPVVMPEAFSGAANDERDWASYMAYFEQCAELNGWNPANGPDLRAQFLTVRLHGAAQRFAATLPNNVRRDWALLTQQLTNRFAPANREALHKASFKARRQGSNESFPELADELRRLVALAYPAAAHALRQELARDQFVEALSSVRLQQRLKEDPPADLDAAVARAVQLDALWSSQRAPLQAAGGFSEPTAQVLPVLGTASVPAASSDTLPALRKAAERLDAATERLVQAAEKLALTTTSAYEARAGSHAAGAQPPWISRTRPHGPPTRWEPTCWHCGLPGHLQRDCPAPGRSRAARGRGRADDSDGQRSGNGR